MADFRTAVQDLIENPVRQPKPVEALEKLAHVRRRRRIIAAVSAATVIVVAIVSGIALASRGPAPTRVAITGPPATTPTATPSTNEIPAGVYAARTADGGLVLVLDYASGTCAGDPTPVPSATETDTPTSVVVHVDVTSPYQSADGSCADRGITGSVTLRLKTALGHRQLIDGSSGKTITPFDGTGFLEPTWLPPGFVLLSDGSPNPYSGSTASTLWTQTWGTARNPNATVCVPGTDVVLMEGYGLPSPTTASTIPPPVTYQVSGQVAQIASTDNGMLIWAPAGHPPGWEVGLLAGKSCAATPMGIATLLRIADGMHPQSGASPSLGASSSSMPAPSSSVAETSTLRPTSFSAARLEKGGRTLVLAYIGGSCDSEVQTTTSETASAAKVTSIATVKVSAGQGCDAAGVLRTAVVTLASPLGSRELLDGVLGTKIVPFDGSGFLEPTNLPAGMVLESEGPGPSAASQWEQDWGYPHSSNSEGCVPGKDELVVTEGYGLNALQQLPDVSPIGQYTVLGQPAQVYDDRRIIWIPADHPPGWEVQVAAQQACTGDSAPSVAALLAFAQSFRPALTPSA